ncbi:oligoribonuclease [Aciduricibacillus chroicocephali]|uniref:Oligoribonuclease n=1 Tax=Aciduricibacillus chroicocephali TaxID=3054939 RepID=A0ABY9KWS3_9BACI|nr:oligoribonuclease [Bacillaceae bacterium 44XB]
MFKLLTHNDLDGVSCGILAKLAFGKKAQVRYNSVAGLDREVAWFLENGDPETFLFITDLSVNEENELALQAFHEREGRVKLLDHHKTSMDFNKYDWAKVEVEDEAGKLKCAASIFYEYLVEEGLLEKRAAISDYIELVRQYDTWEWEKQNNQMARRLNALFYLLSIEEFEEKMLERLNGNEPFYFNDLEKEILKMEDKKMESYIRRKRRELVQLKVGGLFAGVVHAESYHSELGNELGKEYPHLDYIVIINMGGRRAGFRTIHDHVDVSDVASQFGGGGHAKASGCAMSDEVYEHYVSRAFAEEPLREDARRNRFNLKNAENGSLYRNRAGDRFFLHPGGEDRWIIEMNGRDLEREFTSFENAERYVKRAEAAWLAFDEDLVDYLHMDRRGRKS